METQERRQRAVLAAALRDHLESQPGTQATKAKALGISQPRLSDLMRDRIEKFSLDALVSLAEQAGLHLNLGTQKVLLKPQGPRFQNRRGESPFPADPSELGRLDSIAAPKLFLRILRCEAFDVGLSPKDIVLSCDTTSPDGGIDAKVGGSLSDTGLLSTGNTHFQIKTGSSFKPWQPSKLKHELFGSSKNQPSKEALRPAVRQCLDDGDSYSLVVFGHDLLPDQHSRSVHELTQLLQVCGYQAPKVNIIGQGQLAGEIERYPSIYLDLFGFSEDYFLSIRSWREQPLMRTALALGKEQEALVAEIRKTFADHQAAHIRLVGEPGIGKTRLALEALSDDDIAPTVVYVPTGEDFQRSHLFREIIRSERRYPLTLVIDDCDEHDRASIWGGLRDKPAIKLLTIDHGIERTRDSGMRVFECPRLNNEQVEEILKGYISDNADETRKWAEVCDGSPRVAHAVGENLKENPDDILRTPSMVPLWDRYISGYTKSNGGAADEYKIVLRYIALFARFGFESPVSDEGRFISELVSEANRYITYERFQSIVQHFRERRILQGRHTLFLVPKALHIHLWVEFWNHHGREFPFDEFYRRLPTNMRDWFLRLFIYAHKSPQALTVVRSITGSDGPFSEEGFTTSEVGPRLLRYLAEADPRATLACIERTYGQWEHGKLLAWRNGRQDIVWALEKIAVWEDTFEPAVRVLARMALAENAQNSNNSKGTITSLFSIGVGWAATKAPPEKRFQILREFIESNDDAERSLGLELARSWLSTYGGSRIVGPEHQGLRPTIDFWRPETYGEVFQAWRSVWSLLSSELDGSEGHHLHGIADVLTETADGLIRVSNFEDEIIDTLFKLSQIDALDKKALIALVIRILKFRDKQLPSDVIARIRELDEVLTGSTLWDHISRYVLHSNWDEDYVYDGDNVVESDEPRVRLNQLAKELMRSPERFVEYAKKLVTVRGHRLPALGIECGRLATDESWDSLLIRLVEESKEEANSEFFGGFLAGIREARVVRWESALLRLFSIPDVHNLATECVFRSGMSDKIIERMRDLYLSGSIDSNAFNRFSFRFDRNSVSESVFWLLVNSLLDKPTPRSRATAVELIDAFYIDRESAGDLPKDLTVRALIAATKELDDEHHMDAYYWNRVANACIDRYPGNAPDILEAHLTSQCLMRLHNSRASSAAMNIIKTYPDASWKIIADLLEDEENRRYELIFWLGGFDDAPPATLLPVDQVMEWIREDPEHRARRVLQFLPKSLDPEDGGELTVRFIEEFSNQKEIAGTLMAHFWCGSWSGPESQYLEKKRNMARKWLARTESPKVDTWLTSFIANLSDNIESAKIREERDF